jgi:hypothetical protein
MLCPGRESNMREEVDLVASIEVVDAGSGVEEEEKEGEEEEGRCNARTPKAPLTCFDHESLASGESGVPIAANSASNITDARVSGSVTVFVPWSASVVCARAAPYLSLARCSRSERF